MRTTSVILALVLSWFVGIAAPVRGEDDDGKFRIIVFGARIQTMPNSRPGGLPPSGRNRVTM